MKELKEITTFQCEDCKKFFKANSNKFSQMTRCECGGRAFDINGLERIRPMTII